MKAEFFVIYFRDVVDNGDPAHFILLYGTEADAQELVMDLTFEEMYNDFCVEVNLVNYCDPEDCARDKTATGNEDFGCYFHYAPIREFNGFNKAIVM